MIPKRLIEQFIRFAGIGFLNTAVDFAVFNFFAALLSIYIGVEVGILTAVSFTVAVIHSYFWNKYWAFSDEAVAETGWNKNVGQFVAAAFLGGAVMAFVFLAARFQLGAVAFLVLVGVLILGEVGLWKVFKLKRNPLADKSGREFVLFIIISVVGALINSGIVAFGTSAVEPQFGINQELWTNLIKAGATGVALIWNFLGYKLIVFKQ